MPIVSRFVPTKENLKVLRAAAERTQSEVSRLNSSKALSIAPSGYFGFSVQVAEWMNSLRSILIGSGPSGVL